MLSSRYFSACMDSAYATLATRQRFLRKPLFYRDCGLFMLPLLPAYVAFVACLCRKIFPAWEKSIPTLGINTLLIARKALFFSLNITYPELRLVRLRLFPS